MKLKLLIVLFFVSTISVFSQADRSPIPFTEDSTMEVNPTYLEQLGIESLILDSGLYEIQFDSDNPYGFIAFRITSIVTTLTNELDGGNIGIRIAKRVKKTCGGEPVECTCCCGIGFRCGTTSLGYDGDEGDRILASQITINPDAGIFKVRFTNAVDWDHFIAEEAGEEED